MPRPAITTQRSIEMANKQNTTKQTTNTTAVRTVDQLTFGRLIAQKYHFKLSDVMAIIEEEQKLTMEFVRMGCKVIKKNYLTIESKVANGKKGWRCPLNGKTYDLKTKPRVLVRVGIGFKKFISNGKMPDKLCRFVSGDVIVK